ncbi:MAG: hypothetical protein EBY00_03990 [Actinobacteria bacterium]|nr:hypothetical protein [Actinomycetota bacterium]
MKKVILTGGTSKRFGSNKAEAKINGKSLLEILATDLDELIIVGPTTSVNGWLCGGRKWSMGFNW